MDAFSLGRVFWIAVAVLPFYLPPGASAARPPARHFVVLHRFNTTDGSGPLGPLVQDGAGNLYGETEVGGSNSAGVAFELSPHGTHWKETVLHNFGSADGYDPLGGLTLDAQGNLYGTEFSSASLGGGVFELSPAGDGTWNFTQLYTFTAWAQGSNPYSGVLRDAGGNLYGTTYYGGAKCCGTVFELSPAQGGWTESVLYSFRNKPDGAYPAAGIIRDSIGNFYGTTSQGGDGHCGDGDGDPGGCGSVFTLTPSGHRFAETQMYDFQRDEPNAPYAPLTIGPDGLFYGTAEYDVFVVAPQESGGWQKQTIYRFKEGIDGTTTSSGVIFDTAGNLYGTTESSGIEGFNSVYELSPPSQGQQMWTRTTLARLGKGFGAAPQGAILIGAGGTLYGAAGSPGFIFAIRTDG